MANKCNCPPPGLPAYMGTFADLMTLLMCFFVLLLSFSEMDVLKYKQVAGSMLNAFGVQNVLEVKDIPKGTSVIALEFRPGRPEPTPIDTMMQQTSELTQTELEFQPGEQDKSGGQQKEAGQESGGPSKASQVSDASEASADSDSQAQMMKEAAKMLVDQLNEQVSDGSIEVEALGQQLVIRIKERYGTLDMQEARQCMQDDLDDAGGVTPSRSRERPAGVRPVPAPTVLNSTGGQHD